ncbi:hypothetical protein A0O21_08250 [Streptococcus pantholopis]|uniref:Uncharacterized protein n=1 Tax=Streptococcus pantholopis TaxID=1811193 RepID=A0A172Q914_9STRE|nr:hypothetical protein A0O21_08250 [Streptococcus pantholopis]
MSSFLYLFQIRYLPAINISRDKMMGDSLRAGQQFFSVILFNSKGALSKMESTLPHIITK